MSDGLSKQEYLQLRAALTFEPSVLPTVAILIMDGCALWAATHLLQSPGILAYLGSQLLLAMVYFNMFVVLHECGHGSVSKSRLLNVILGHIASVFCAIPFYPWRYIHQKHHAFAGCIDHDPVLSSIRGWKYDGVPPIVRFGWRSWVPLAALAQQTVYWRYPLVMRRSGELSRTKLIRCTASIAWLFVAYACLATFGGELVSFANLWLSVVLFLGIVELVNIPHHTDVSTFDARLPVWEQYKATRSCYYPRGCSELLVLNFNFHTEHHLFPTLPWFRLRRARDLVRQRLGGSYREAVGIGWNLENRQRDLQSIVANVRITEADDSSRAGRSPSGWRLRDVPEGQESR